MLIKLTRNIHVQFSRIDHPRGAFLEREFILTPEEGYKLQAKRLVSII